MKIKWNRLNRDIHHWGAILIALPMLVVIVTGILLLLKKESDWIQPPSMKGQGSVPIITYKQILDTCRSIKETEIKNWSDIKRMDYRPSKGLVKVITKNNWELQLDLTNGQLLSKAFRRSDIIESIHDGSFFHDKAKLGLFLPAAIGLLVLWITGIYLFIIRQFPKKRSKKRLNNVSLKNLGKVSKKTLSVRLLRYLSVN